MRSFVSVFLLIVISLVIVLGVSLGLGWILTLFLPFSLFEGTLLGMIAVVSTFVIWHTVLRSSPPYGFDDEDFDVEPEEIPHSKFWGKNADRTWENWFRYMLANSIYEDFHIAPHWMGSMNAEKLQGLSIRLADAGIEALKKKSPYAKRLRVSRGTLKHEMDRVEQGPYDEDVLGMAAAAINAELRDYDRELREVVKGQLWEEPADVFE